MRRISLRLAVLAAALQQAILPFVVNPFRDGQDAVRAGEASQIEPAAYAFSIWSLIYLGALAYAVHQLTFRDRTDAATARIAPFAIVLYAGSTLWLAVATYGPLWATMPILVVMTACAIYTLVTAVRAPEPSIRRIWFITVPFGLYAGWTACATFVNIAEVAPQYGFDRFGLSIPVYAALSIAAIAIIATFVLRATRGEIAFAGAVAWALIAVLAAGAERGYESPPMVAAGLALVIVVSLTAYLQWRTRAEAARDVLRRVQAVTPDQGAGGVSGEPDSAR